LVNSRSVQSGNGFTIKTNSLSQHCRRFAINKLAASVDDSSEQFAPDSHRRDGARHLNGVAPPNASQIAERQYERLVIRKTDNFRFNTLIAFAMDPAPSAERCRKIVNGGSQTGDTAGAADDSRREHLPDVLRTPHNFDRSLDVEILTASSEFISYSWPDSQEFGLYSEVLPLRLRHA
jgi:hypothetical protein